MTRLHLLFLALLLTGCPSGNDDDSANDDDAADDDDAANDDDAVGDDDDSASGGPCAQAADHVFTLTVDPATLSSQAADYTRFYWDAQATASSTAVSAGDTVGFELTFDPPLIPGRDVVDAPIEMGWLAAIPTGGAETQVAPTTTSVSPSAFPSSTLSPSTIMGRVYPKQGGGQALSMQVPVGEWEASGTSLECVGATFTVPAGVAEVAADGMSINAECDNSFCGPNLWDGVVVGDDDDAGATPDACDIWADNIHEVILTPPEFTLSNDGSTNGVLRWDADFFDFGITPNPDQSYAFVAQFTEPLEIDGEWDLVELYFDNTYPTTNNTSVAGPIPYAKVGSSDLVPDSPFNNGQTNGSALEWVPGSRVIQTPPNGSEVVGSIDCVAFAFLGGEYMTTGNVLIPPSTTPMSRLTLRADCAGVGPSCTGDHVFGFGN